MFIIFISQKVASHCHIFTPLLRDLVLLYFVCKFNNALKMCLKTVIAIIFVQVTSISDNKVIFSNVIPILLTQYIFFSNFAIAINC